MKVKYIIVIILFILVLNPSLCAVGGYEGLTLWFNIIIPTLMPFMIISNVLVASSDIGNKPQLYGALIGTMCGYPMGAIIAVKLYENKLINLNSAHILACLFNMASPGFVVAYIANHCLNNHKMTFPILVSLYLPIIFLYFIANKFYTVNALNTTAPSDNDLSIFKIIDNAIYNASMTTIKLGGYIIIFSIFAYAIKALPISSVLLKSCIISSFEITNGIKFIANSTLSEMQRFVMAASFTAFGGLSCIAQTQCIFLNTDLSIKKYIYCKIVLALLTALTSSTIYVLIY